MNPATIVFVIVISVMVFITWRAARYNRTANHYYTAGGDLSAAQNGLALCGNWISAAAFLGYAGLVSLYGLDGAFYALGGLMAFGVIMLLIAEPLRNIGKYTIGDVINYRMRSRAALLAVIISSIFINVGYLAPQLSSAGALVTQLTGLPYDVVVIAVGLAVIVYVAFGGMLATTWVQIIKALMLFMSAAVIFILVLRLVNFNPLMLFDKAAARYGPRFLGGGNYLKSHFDGISFALGVAMGPAGLPHLMTRFYTVPDAKTARHSIQWVMFLAGGFMLITTLFGVAAADFVGQDAIRAADKGGNLALPLLAQYVGGGPGSVGGQILEALVSALAFATILAVMAALMLATAGTIAHDFYANCIKRGEVETRKEILVARLSVAAFGALSILLGIFARNVNVSVLIVLAVCIAASTNFPIIVLSLFWKRFNPAGVVTGVLFGLVSSVLLAVLGPAIQGPTAIWPLINPSIISIPLGFLGAIIGTLLYGRDAQVESRYDEVQFRIHTGVEMRPEPP